MKLLERFFSVLPHELAQDLTWLLDFLSSYNLQVYATGGGVRDLFFGRNITDIDLEIHKISPESFDALMQTLGAKGVGKSFFVYKWRGIDLALARNEKKIAQGHRGFEVAPAHDTKEAASRRDFTFNALMLNLYTGELLDFFNGEEDITKRTIRVINQELFKQDSLRVLRAVRFCAQLDCTINRRDLTLLRSINIDDLSNERIWKEFSLLLRSTHILRGIQALRATKLDEKLFHKPIDSHTYSYLKSWLLSADSQDLSPYSYLFPLYLLWQCRFLSRTEILKIFPSMSLKERSFFASQKRMPRYISERFLVGLSLKYPLSQWLGIRDISLLQKAKRLKILKGFTPLTTPRMLMSKGYNGKRLGEALQEQIRKEIMSFKR